MESDLHDTNVRERVVPTENVQLMFHYRNPFVVCYPSDAITHQPRSIVSGLSNTYSDVSTFGEAGVVFVTFHPAGACHFFNFPLHIIENQSINLADIFDKEIKQVEELLFLKVSKVDKIKVIEDFLLKRFSPIPSYDYSLLQVSLQLIKQNKGQISASTLSDKLSVTTKLLERKFAEYLGKSPKQFIKLIRFQETLIDFSMNKNINFTEYAYRNGYFDQSHFIRDFKLYAGYTPKEFMTKYPEFNINADSC